MASILFLILAASFGAIGFVAWLKALAAAIKAGSGWVWPTVTGIVAIAVGLAASIGWNAFVPGKGPMAWWSLWPLLFLVTIATIELGYQIVISTFLSLVQGLASLLPCTKSIVEKVEKTVSSAVPPTDSAGATPATSTPQ
jgi:hypothetical protein